MPATAPHILYRTPPAVPTSGGPPAGPLARHAPPAAAEVYGFLSSFTAGVQRGLEAARAARGEGPVG